MDINNNVQINTFIKGMNTDTSDMLLSPELYREAVNLRLSTNTDNNFGELHMIEGTDLFSDYFAGFDSILKIDSIRNLIIVIAKKTTTSTQDNITISTTGWNVYKKDVTSESDFTKIATDDFTENIWDYGTLSTVLNYESENNIYLYIADGHHLIMKINVSSNDSQSITFNDIISYTNINLPVPKVEYNTEEGNIPAGKVQYSYRVYKKHGVLSEMSMLSNIISIYADGTLTSGSKGYKDGEISKRSVNITVKGLDNDYYIKVYRLLYKLKNQPPVINIIYDDIVPAAHSDNDRIIVDNGINQSDSLSYEEYISQLTSILLKPKIILLKDNYLFAANTEYVQQSTDALLSAIKRNVTNYFTISAQYITSKSTSIENQSRTKIFRHGETYKFGIILYNTEGIASEVIPYPAITIADLNYSDISGSILTFSMYVPEVKLQINSDHLAEIKDSYSKVELVRAERGIELTKNITLGIIGTTIKGVGSQLLDVPDADNIFYLNRACPSGFITMQDIKQGTDSSLPEVFESCRNVLLFVSPEILYDTDNYYNVIKDYYKNSTIVPSLLYKLNNTVTSLNSESDIIPGYWEDVNPEGVSPEIVPTEDVSSDDLDSQNVPSAYGKLIEIADCANTLLGGGYSNGYKFNYYFSDYDQLKERLLNLYAVKKYIGTGGYEWNTSLPFVDYQNRSQTDDAFEFVVPRNKISDNGTTFRILKWNGSNFNAIRERDYTSPHVKIGNITVQITPGEDLLKNGEFYSAYISNPLSDIEFYSQVAQGLEPDAEFNPTLYLELTRRIYNPIAVTNKYTEPIYIKTVSTTTVNPINIDDCNDYNSILNPSPYETAYFLIYPVFLSESRVDYCTFKIQYYIPSEISSLAASGALYSLRNGNVNNNDHGVLFSYNNLSSSTEYNYYTQRFFIEKYDRAFNFGNTQKYWLNEGLVYNIATSQNYLGQNVNAITGIEDITIVTQPKATGFSDNSNLSVFSDITTVGSKEFVPYTVPYFLRKSADSPQVKTMLEKLKEEITTNQQDDEFLRYANTVKSLVSYPVASCGKCLLISTSSEYSGSDFVPSQNRYDLFPALLVNIQKTPMPYPENPTYYHFGDCIEITDNLTAGNAYVIATSGDTYFQVMEYNAAHVVYDNTYFRLPTMCTVYRIPLETSIDMSAEYGTSYTKQDESGFIQDTPVSFPNYQQNKSCYLYNDIYGYTNTAVTAHERYKDDQELTKTDCRIYSSQKKENGEIIDSWLDFKAADFIDLDYTHGEITELDVFNNQLIVWLKDATAIVSVNERQLVNSVDGTQIILGTGGVLSRFDYITTLYGMLKDLMCHDQSNSTLYWWDSIRRELLGYSTVQQRELLGHGGGQQVVPLTAVKNLRNYINSGTNSSNPRVIYDNKYKELLANVIDGESLVYNELIQAFSAIYEIAFGENTTVNDNIYLADNKKLYIWNKPLLYDEFAEITSGKILLSCNSVDYNGNLSEDITTNATLMLDIAEHNLSIYIQRSDYEEKFGNDTVLKVYFKNQNEWEYSASFEQSGGDDESFGFILTNNDISQNGTKFSLSYSTGIIYESKLYSSDTNPSLKYVVNQVPQYNKTFDSITFGGRFYGGSELEDSATYNKYDLDLNKKHHNSNLSPISMEFYTPLKQHAEINNIDWTSIREYDYRLNVPRDTQDTSKIPAYGNRMKGKTMRCEIKSSSNSIDFSLQYITTKYRISWS